MMKRILVVFWLLMAFGLEGQVPEFEWAKSIGGTNTDRGYDVTTDLWGNIYTTGLFRDTVDFDPGAGEYILTAPGGSGRSLFVTKLNPEGDFIWALSIRATEGRGITTDDVGNVYVTGYFNNTVDFDPGPDTFFLSAGVAAFVLKLDSNGSFIWAKQIGGGIGATISQKIAVSTIGDIYITGRFQGVQDFDPGTNEYNLVSYTLDDDAFILKLNSEGNFVWVKTRGEEYNDNFYALSIGNDNNIYITGKLEEIQWDPELYIAKLNSEGDFLWEHRFLNYEGAVGQAIAIDESENVYITGQFFGTLDFDPGADTYFLTSQDIDGFILKLTAEGGFVWAKSYGSNGLDHSADIAVDRSGVYVAGDFDGLADLDPGSDTFSVSSLERDAFVLKLDTTGSFIWSKVFSGTGGNDEAFSLTLDRWNNIYTVGRFTEVVDFDPDSTVYELTSNGSGDIFLHKISQPCLVNPVIVSSLNTSPACPNESISLMVEIPSEFTAVSYEWSTGDSSSAITIAPTVTSNYALSLSYIDNTTVCHKTDSFTIEVYEASDTTYLSMASCDSLDVGTFTAFYSDENGCDSVVIEMVDLIPLLGTPVIPSETVIQENEPPFQITVPEVVGATGYEWTVPTGVDILSGTDTNTIVVDWSEWGADGTICVSAQNDCGSSSAVCMEVIIDSTDAVEKAEKERVIVFPNPTTNLLNIIFTSQKYRALILLDSSTKIYSRQEITNEKASINTSDLPSGIYWLKIIEDDRVFWKQIAVQ